MSFSAEKREDVRRYMLTQITNGKTDFIKSTANEFCISETTIRRYVKELLAKQIISYDVATKCYRVVSHTYYDHIDLSQNCDEDIIFRQSILPYVEDLPQNVVDIWTYTCCEILNNAIEHSSSKTVSLLVKRDYINTSILIIDNGIGIFKRIMQYCNSKGENIDLNGAVDKLFAGKFTTAESGHSGEGIFFSSKMVDSFFILSSGKIFMHKHNNMDDLLFNAEDPADLSIKEERGTTVYMILSNFSLRTVEEVFKIFSDESNGFFKTKLPMSHIIETGYPVSRSQARRVCAMCDKFETIILDFTNIRNIGQGFAHEMFVVYPKNHPEKEVLFENANDTVCFMINRVIATDKKTLES